MKKLIALLALVAVFAMPALAQMEAREYASTHVATAAATTTYALRGELYGIYVDMPAGSPTATVAVVASPHGTIFSRAGITADGLYSPRLSTHTTGGAAWPMLLDATGSSTNVPQALIPLAGDVAVTVTPTTQVVTNDYKVYLIYRSR